MTEEWRDIPGFEGTYQVSNLGRVQSLGRTVPHQGGRRPIRARILHPFVKPTGHLRVDLGRGDKGGARVAVHVHTLVLLAFVGPRPRGLEIRHLNGVPSDNRLVNLEYATKSRNSLDIKWHGGRANRHLAPRDVLSILRRRSGQKDTRAALAQEYGVGTNSISNIWHGRTHRDVDPDKFNDEVGR